MIFFLFQPILSSLLFSFLSRILSNHSLDVVYVQVPFKEEFITEMKFILKFEGNTKEVRHRKSESVDSTQNSVKSYPSNESGMAHAGCSDKTAWEIMSFTRFNANVFFRFLFIEWNFDQFDNIYIYCEDVNKKKKQEKEAAAVDS